MAALLHHAGQHVAFLSNNTSGIIRKPPSASSLLHSSSLHTRALLALPADLRMLCVSVLHGSRAALLYRRSSPPATVLCDRQVALLASSVRSERASPGCQAVTFTYTREQFLSSTSLQKATSHVLFSSFLTLCHSDFTFASHPG